MLKASSGLCGEQQNNEASAQKKREKGSSEPFSGFEKNARYWDIPPVRLGLCRRNSGRIQERPRKRSQSVSWYGWDPPSPIIQGIRGFQSISRILSPPVRLGKPLFSEKWFRRGPLRAVVMEFPAVLGAFLSQNPRTSQRWGPSGTLIFLSLFFFWKKKNKENHQKSKDIFIPSEPLKSLGKKRKTLKKKTRNSLERKKARNSKKTRKIRVGAASSLVAA